MRRRVKGKWLGVAAALTACLCLAVGQTHARYLISDSVDCLVPAPAAEAEVSGDLLVPGGQTVLLSDWELPPEEPTEMMTLSEQETAPDIELTRTVPLISVPEGESLTAGDFVVTAEDGLSAAVTVAEGQAQLTLTLAADAVSQPEAKTVSVKVSGAGKEATFLVNLVPQGTVADDTLLTSATIMASAVEPAMFLRLTGSGPCTLAFCGADVLTPLTGVRCSLDGGASWTLLYDLSQLRFTPDSGWNGILLLDLTQTQLAESNLNVLFSANYSMAPVQRPDTSLDTAPFVLPADGTGKTLTVQTDWLGCQFTCQLQMLQRQDGDLVWAQVTEAADLITIGDSGVTLAVPQAGNPLPAGSYRLCMTWSVGEQPLYETAVDFFVNGQLYS